MLWSHCGWSDGLDDDVEQDDGGAATCGGKLANGVEPVVASDDLRTDSWSEDRA